MTTLADHTGTRRCAAGDTCRDYDPTTGPPDDHGQPQGAAAQARHGLCDGCLDRAEHAIRLLPHDWRDLEQQLPPALGVWGEGGRADGREAPVPLQLQVEALQAAIWRVSTTWEEVIRDVARLSDVDRHRPPRMRRVWVATVDTILGTVQGHHGIHPSAALRELRPGPVDVVRAVRVLVPRLGVLADVGPVELVDYPLEALVGPLYRPGREPHVRWDCVRRYRGATYATVPGWQGVLDLAALHRRATAVLGLTSPVKRLPGVCACGREELRQEAPQYLGHEPEVYCGAGCGAWWPYDEWRRQAQMWGTAA